MGSYKLVVKPSVEKDFRKLPKETASRLFQLISDLANNPFPRQCVKLIGADKIFRIRFRDYRIVYEVNSDDREVIIHYVRHRKDAYRTS